MEKSYFSLEVNKSNKIIRIFQIVFGIICAVVALVWLIINIRGVGANLTLIITIIFLLGFAYYQINSGLGKGEKFIEISQSAIKLKKNSVLPAQLIQASDIESIEVFPLKIDFKLKSGRTVILRFGTTFIDNIEMVKEKIKKFARMNKITHEILSEEF